jgi:hypothetical protein
VIVYLLLCFLPFFKCFYKQARLQLGYTLFNIAISPFGNIEFREFFMAEILTSMGQIILDIGLIYVYFKEDNWVKGNPVEVI